MRYVTVKLVYSIHGTSRTREQSARILNDQMRGVRIMAEGQDNQREGEVWIGALYKGRWIH